MEEALRRPLRLSITTRTPDLAPSSPLTDPAPIPTLHYQYNTRPFLTLHHQHLTILTHHQHTHTILDSSPLTHHPLKHHRPFSRNSSPIQHPYSNFFPPTHTSTPTPTHPYITTLSSHPILSYPCLLTCYHSLSSVSLFLHLSLPFSSISPLAFLPLHLSPLLTLSSTRITHTSKGSKWRT